MPIDTEDASNGMVAADSLRSELIFIGESGSVETSQDGALTFTVVRTPDIPTYWWGNTLHFDGPPADGDVERWAGLFERHVQALQPLSTHRTFSWDGGVAGCVEPFVERGYTYFEVLVLAADPATPLSAPHRHDSARIAALSGADWDALQELLVDTREPFHTLDGYIPFARGRVSRWKALAEAGQGSWFGAWLAATGEERLQSALGVYVEAVPGPDGRRIGRFQHVTTREGARRQGLAGTLVAHAARFGFETLVADRLLIMADEHDVARRVYESVGFFRAGVQRGLELGNK